MKLKDIVKDPVKRKLYGKFVFPEDAYNALKAGDTNPRVIAVVAKNPMWAFDYVKDVIKGRWPEGEPAIAKKPMWAYRYAREVIKNRWAEGEPAIAKHPEWAYDYARNVIKGPWPEAGIT